MKFNKQDLRDLIREQLQESGLVSTHASVVGIEDSVETFAFENHANAIRGNLDQMGKIINQDSNLERKSLVLFKEKVLEDLKVGIDFLEGAIEAKLKDQIEGL
jgi:t-SNARE complex subunit (syntaxin)